jgi:hypothetical protein
MPHRETHRPTPSHHTYRRLLSRSASCRTFPRIYTMMSAPMSTEDEHQAREETRWTLWRWWIR